MNGSWKLGRVAGIDLRIHWTFLLLPLYVYFSTVQQGASSLLAVYYVLFVLAVFACVVLHELGHALAARSYGIGTRDITLLPIGGVAALERMPRAPFQELVIAVAGPLVNVVIAVVIYYLMPVLAGVDVMTKSFLGKFLMNLATVNVALFLFNLVPAFPMDGGRVLRALLAFGLPYRSATNAAVFVGQFVALGLGVIGIVNLNWMLVFIAGFVFLAGSSERKMVEMAEQPTNAHTSGTSAPVAEGIFYTEPLTMDSMEVIDDNSHPSVPAEMSAELAMRWMSRQQDDVCEVVSHGSIIGHISRLDLIRAVADGFGNWPLRRLLQAG